MSNLTRVSTDLAAIADMAAPLEARAKGDS